MESDQLPSYTPRSSGGQGSSEKRISRADYKGHKWLLSVKSRATIPESLPVFYGGDPISGSVTLDLLKPDSFKYITVTVTAGNNLRDEQQEFQFLHLEKKLWSPAAGSNGSIVSVSKLEKGNYVWPFEFILPKEVEVIDHKEKKLFPLPPSFTETASPVYIIYRITVFVRRSALGMNHSFFTEFAYTPITKPSLPSPLIQMSYTEGLSLVGPEVDPEGWHILPLTSVTGTLFDIKPVNVDFTLALIKPLSYPCSSAMPLRLIFMGADEQALDVLSSPHAPTVLLKRSLDAGSKREKEFVDTMARAVFWPLKSANTVGTRVLQGEIKLKQTLKQSFVFPRFAVKYYLEVLPFNATGFVRAPHVTGPLLTQPVNITSSHATGIVMRSFAPSEHTWE